MYFFLPMMQFCTEQQNEIHSFTRAFYICTMLHINLYIYIIKEENGCHLHDWIFSILLLLVSCALLLCSQVSLTHFCIPLKSEFWRPKLSPPMEHQLKWRQKWLNLTTCVKSLSLGTYRNGKYSVQKQRDSGHSLRCRGENTNALMFLPSSRVMKPLLWIYLVEIKISGRHLVRICS